MSGYQSGEQPQAGKFIKLNTNENPYPPSANVTQAIHAVLEGSLARYPDPFATPFRLRAADVLGVEPEWILCGNGSDDLLTIATRAFVGQGQLIRLPYPSYILYTTLADIQGAAYEEITFNDDWSLPAEFAQAAEHLRLAFLPNPNSPSGTLISPAEVSGIAENLNCPLLIDEAYVDFADENCIDLVKHNPRILVSRSLSKSYALAGLRFGFMVGQPEMIEQLQKVKDSYNCDALAIAGATAAIDDQNWLAENRRRVVATRDRMTDALSQLGFSVVPSQANFVWCTHSERSAESTYEALKKERVLIRYMNYPRWGEGLRISVGTDAQVDVCLELLKNVV